MEVDYNIAVRPDIMRRRTPSREESGEKPLKNLSILGASGSIGTQALEVLRREPTWRLLGVSVHQNIAMLQEILLEFKPEHVAVSHPDAYKPALEMAESIGYQGRIHFGMEGLMTLATLEDADMVLTSLVGMVGLKPTLAAIEAGKDIALANKETLVAAGELVMRLAKKHGVRILPVDSEHSAIFQCLLGGRREEVKRIILTASGGPFRGKSSDFLKGVTKEMALRHPNWTMGAKITIDSSTLMNKGLEVIEARWLFDMPYEAIDVLVHPESIIHSMVEFRDHSILAQMGHPDMMLPIQYALNYPERHFACAAPLDFAKHPTLRFEPPDRTNFPALSLAYEAGGLGGLMPCVMNSANEEAVALFLKDQIPYGAITDVVRDAMQHFNGLGEITLEKVLETDEAVRAYVRRTHNL